MGGHVFASGPDPLHTPRMPPTVYAHAKETCHQALATVFESVATPIEGPGKQDYGDIDILVHGRREAAPGSVDSAALRELDDDPRQAIYRLLGAKRMKVAGACPSFAIPWPKPPPGHLESLEDGDHEPRFIQVDVHIYEDLQAFKWSLFHDDHGDVWNLLGATIRPYGLTINDVGLYVRNPEIEKENRNKAKILLTRDPAEVLDFLGLDYDTWTRPFASTEEAYEYAATSRFFWVRPNTAAEGNDGEGLDAGAEFKKQELKSNDRQRMNKRPMFRFWIDEFVPRCRREGRFTEQKTDREKTLVEAFERFGVQQEYENRFTDYRKQRQAETLWRTVIKAALPEEGIDCQWRGVTASAFKKIIMNDDESFGIRPAKPLKDNQGLYLEDEVRRFVQDRWEEVGKVAWQQNQEKGRIQGTKRRACSPENGIASDKAPKQAAEDQRSTAT